jgi:hypothetical protein
VWFEFWHTTKDDILCLFWRLRLIHESIFFQALIGKKQKTAELAYDVGIRSRGRMEGVAGQMV